jgi:hypothetical protein
MGSTAKTISISTAADKRPLLYPLFHALKRVGSVALITDNTGYLRLKDENGEFGRVYIKISPASATGKAIEEAENRGGPLDFAFIDMSEHVETDVEIEPKESDIKALTIELAEYVYSAEKKGHTAPLKKAKAIKIAAPFVSTITGRDTKLATKLLKGGDAK